METLTSAVESGCVQNWSAPPPIGFPVPPEDGALVERLRNRDEASFRELVRRYHGSLVRLAQSFVHDRAVAEEVAQETWVGVLRGIEQFAGRSSLKTWIFQILINRAKSRGVRDARSVPFSALGDRDSEAGDPTVNPSRFFPSEDPECPDGWVSKPQQWDMTPEQLLLSQECRSYIEQAIASLPELQKEVITLRDVQGWSSEEVGNILGVSESNVRVLLHRARSRVRQAMGGYLGAYHRCRRHPESAN